MRRTRRRSRAFVQIVEMPTPSYPMKFQPSGGIAVIADNTWAAIQGRNALKIKWDDGPHGNLRLPGLSRGDGGDRQASPARSLRSEGDFAAAFASADKKVEAEYYIPHNAHATMEPPSATCRIVDGKAEVWTSVQSPQAAHDLVAAVSGASARERHCQRDAARRRFRPQVEAGLRGRGGFVLKGDGRRAGESRVDARGRHPQRLLPHGVGSSVLQAGLDKDGNVVAWRHNSVAPTILSLFMADPKHEAPLEQGMGLVDVPFDIKNVSIENGEAEAHTKIGWWRSVSNVPHGFAIQSFVAELAAAAGKDQKRLPARSDRTRRASSTCRRTVKNFWDYGENPDVYPDRHRTACATSSNSSPRRRAGASASCRKATALASPSIAAS